MSTFPWMSFDNWWICRCENLLKRHFEVSSWSEDPNICARLKLFRMLWASWGHMKQCWYMLHNIFFSVSESVGDPRFVLSSIVWERRVWKFLSSCVTSCCLCKHAFWLDEMEVSRKRNIMEIHKIEWMSIDVFVEWYQIRLKYLRTLKLSIFSFSYYIACRHVPRNNSGWCIPGSFRWSVGVGSWLVVEDTHCPKLLANMRL